MASNSNEEHKSNVSRRLYVSRFSSSVNVDEIHQVFSNFGEVTDIELDSENSGTGKLSCFVTYSTRESALAAVTNARFISLGDSYVQVCEATPRKTQIFVGGLKPDVTNDMLKIFFAGEGDVCDAIVKTDPRTGASRCFGFVTFMDCDHIASKLCNQRFIDCYGKKIEVKQATPISDYFRELKNNNNGTLGGNNNTNNSNNNNHNSNSNNNRNMNHNNNYNNNNNRARTQQHHNFYNKRGNNNNNKQSNTGNNNLNYQNNNNNNNNRRMQNNNMMHYNNVNNNQQQQPHQQQHFGGQNNNFMMNQQQQAAVAAMYGQNQMGWQMYSQQMQQHPYGQYMQNCMTAQQQQQLTDYQAQLQLEQQQHQQVQQVQQQQQQGQQVQHVVQHHHQMIGSPNSNAGETEQQQQTQVQQLHTSQDSATTTNLSCDLANATSPFVNFQMQNLVAASAANNVATDLYAPMQTPDLGSVTAKSANMNLMTQGLSTLKLNVKNKEIGLEATMGGSDEENSSNAETVISPFLF